MTGAILEQSQDQTVADEVSSRLRAEILRGELLPGTRLIELEIASRLNTSQTSVRGALARLEHDGLAKRRSRRGTYVTEIAPEEIYEVFTIRTVIEELAIQRAISAIGPKHLHELRSLVDQMRKAGTAGDVVAVVDCDMLFHRRICEWAKQDILLRSWVPLFTHVQRFLLRSHPRYFANLAEIADAHLPIVDALVSGDPARASQVLREHTMELCLSGRLKRDIKQPG